MTTKAVQISIDRELLRRIDEDSEVREKGRSAFIRSAVELYLRAKERRTIDDQVARAYEGHGDEMLDEIAELMPAQSWPSD